MSGGMAFIRKTYCVPAKRGMEVRFRGISYYILSVQDGKLRLWRCKKNGQPEKVLVHPTWEMEYITHYNRTATTEEGEK